MSKTVQRLLTFFIGIPLIVGIVFLSYFNHLILNIVISVISVIAATEMYNIFSKKTVLFNKFLLQLFTILLPIGTYLLILFGKSTTYIAWLLLFEILILLGVEVYTHKSFDDSNQRITASVFILLYCGYMITFVSRMGAFKDSTIIICIFLLAVFMCDSIAWLFGVLLGKNNRGVFAVSPNKSIAGFCGGFLGSIASCVLAWFLSGPIFQKDILSGSVWKAILLGFLCAISSITGDLVESVFKRSSGEKDSGNIIPGRGGILDSIDSILFSAPVFYIIFYILYSPEFQSQIIK